MMKTKLKCFFGLHSRVYHVDHGFYCVHCGRGLWAPLGRVKRRKHHYTKQEWDNTFFGTFDCVEPHTKEHSEYLLKPRQRKVTPMTHATRAEERTRGDIRAMLLAAMRQRETLAGDVPVPALGLVLHPDPGGGMPYATDGTGRSYRLGPSGRLIIEDANG